MQNVWVFFVLYIYDIIIYMIIKDSDVPTSYNFITFSLQTSVYDICTLRYLLKSVMDIKLIISSDEWREWCQLFSISRVITYKLYRRKPSNLVYLDDFSILSRDLSTRQPNILHITVICVIFNNFFDRCNN